MGRYISGVGALAVLLGLAGCTSTASGQGTAAGSRTPLVTVDPESDTPTATATASPSMSARGGGGTGQGGTGQGGDGGGSTSRPPTGTGTPTRTASTDPNAPAQLLLYEVAAGPSCTATSGSSTVTLVWQTRAGTEVWIQITPVAVGASDPKTTPGSHGPLPANGRTTLPFDCAGQYGYYNLAVYNTGNGTHAGELLQVPRNL